MTTPDLSTPRGSQAITIKIRLCDKHASELTRQARAVNLVWNYVNETSAFAWRRDRRWLSAFDLGKLTSGSSRELDIHAHTIKRVCDQFARSRDKAKRAALRWRGVKSLGWVPFNTGHVSFDGEVLKFRGVRFRMMHQHPRLTAGIRIGAGSFNQDSRGRWYINIPILVECARPKNAAAVGIDLGLKDFATLSDGGKIESPRFYRKCEIAIGRTQTARKSKRARAIHAKVANRRKDYLHKASAKIASQYGTVIVGDVESSKLARTRWSRPSRWCNFGCGRGPSSGGFGGDV